MYDEPIGSVIDWYGPYETLESLITDSQLTEGNRWLYAAVDVSGGTGEITYIGLTTRPAGRFRQHHKLKNVGCDVFFLGEITSFGKSGARSGAKPVDLERAEHALIYFFQPRWNDVLKGVAPTGCVSLFSRFWKVDEPNDPVPTPEYFPNLIGFNSWTEEWFPDAVRRKGQ